MNRVVHFEINADDPERAAKFYTEIFGWEITKWEGSQPYWMVTTGPKEESGINGGIMHRLVNNTTVNTVEVESVDGSLKKIETAGGKVIKPKDHIPGVGYFAYCQDSEGNTFGLIENDLPAK